MTEYWKDVFGVLEKSWSFLYRKQERGNPAIR